VVDLCRAVVILEPLVPGEHKISVLDGGQKSLGNPEAEEQTELIGTNEALQEGEGLEAFLVRQLSE